MRRRKNSFGTMFGGAFGDEKAARKKARKVHGAVMPKIINGQRRYMVMSERKNPIRRRRNGTSLRKVEALEQKKQELTQQRDWVQRDVSNLEAQGHTLNVFDRRFLKHRKKALHKLDRNLAKVEAKLVKAARTNPSELIVLGANPHPTESQAAQEEILLPPNSTIMIRTNPARVNAGQGYGYDFHGAFTEKADAIEKERTIPGAFIKGRITNRGFRWIVMTKRADEPRQNVEFREFDHGIFHPWTRRPKTRRKPATRRLKRGNPSAPALREEFVGVPAEFETVLTEPHMPAGDYAQLGELLALYVKPGRGQQVQQIAFADRPMLVSDESARQLYFVGGDQDISGSLAVFGAEDHGGGHFQLGEVRRIDYKQRKEHVAHPDLDEWRHEFGEESGVRPVLWFDANAHRLLLKGGEYEIRREGIVN
jgi:hypothetical protein